ncbi:MAG TPA: M1 family peptidase, partial [Pedobacter sp.]
MNNQFIQRTLLFAVFFAFSISTQAQQDPAVSNYDQHLAFSPLFYTQNGNEYRSANGYPGPKYWQNRADYNISANLDDQKNTVTGTVTITYKNNSPDQLPFLWLQLDQNLFEENSRGNGLIKAGSRYGARGEKLNGG